MCTDVNIFYQWELLFETYEKPSYAILLTFIVGINFFWNIACWGLSFIQRRHIVQKDGVGGSIYIVGIICPLGPNIVN